MSGVFYVVTLATALGCGLMAGAFFAFSSFVMPALKRLEPDQGIAAMQSMLAVPRVFMTALLGTAVACLGLAGWALISSNGRTTALVLAGCVLYLVGSIGVTMVCNVPLNNRLAKLDPQSAEAPVRWDRFLTRWTAWNHVRTIAASAAAATLTIALQV